MTAPATGPTPTAAHHPGAAPAGAPLVGVTSTPA